MISSYAQKPSIIQKVASSKAASVLDSSSQSESLQRKAGLTNNAAQLEDSSRPNNTGMPDNLKAGIESLSGFSMDDVRVHYNSSKPATVQALAYTQGTDIHVAPGQEKCLPHEAWHVAQQLAGRVSPTTNINGMPVNNNAALEHEADVMGERAVQCKKTCALVKKNTLANVLQGKFYVRYSASTGGYYYWVHDEIDEPDPRYYRFTGEFWNDNGAPHIYPVYENTVKEAYNIFYQENNPSNPHIRKDAKLRGIHYGKRKEEMFRLNELSEEKYVKKNEDVLIVSHGSRPSFLRNSTFTDYSARELAAKMIGRLPDGYKGEIYLDGCHTGEPLKKLDDGSSFAERFGYYLKKMAREKNQRMKFRVKGNLGTAVTQDNGKEFIERDKKTKSLINANLLEHAMKNNHLAIDVLEWIMPLGSLVKYFKQKDNLSVNDISGQDEKLRNEILESLKKCQATDQMSILAYLENDNKLVSRWLALNENLPKLNKKTIVNGNYFIGKYGKRIYTFDTEQ